MGFANQERINLNSKVLAASVIDANETTQWYESRNLNEFSISPGKVLLDLPTLRQYPAANLAAAQANALVISDIIEDRSADGYAIRLTQVPGAAGTWVALSTYGNFSSERLENWIQPQAVPQTTGSASIGYAIELYNGQPGAGGVLVNSTAGLTGSGSTASVGWIFNYAQGLLLLSADFRGTITDPWIKGFRYIGPTVSDLPRDGYVAIQEVFTASSSAPEDFELANQPDPNTLMVWNAGFKLRPVNDYTVSGSTVTIISGTLDPGDLIDIFYFTSISGVITVIPVVGGNQNLSQTLNIGNETDGYNIIVSTGDVIQGETALTLETPGATSSGAINLNTGNSTTGNGGNVNISPGDGGSGGNGGGFFVFAGDATVANLAGGNVTIAAGDGLNTAPNSQGGNLLLQSGGGYKGGNVSIQSDGVYNTGGITIQGGSATNNSGAVTLSSGTADSGVSGSILISSGSTTTGASGGISVVTGTVSSGTEDSGSLTIASGNNTGSGNSGGLSLNTGNTSGTGIPGSAGTISVSAGAASGSGAYGGGINLNAGSGVGNGGDINISPGDSTGGPGGDLSITPGTGNSATNHGSTLLKNHSGVTVLEISARSGLDAPFTVFSDGYFHEDLTVDGKLTVNGLIDPTGLVLDLQPTVPGGTPVAGKSTIWIRESDGYVIATDSNGDDVVLSGGGGGGGSQSLSQTLAIGNTTGAYDIVISSSSEITTASGDDLTIRSSDGAGGSGQLYLQTLASTVATGSVYVQSGAVTGSGGSGNILLQSGNVTGTGTGGYVLLYAADSTGGVGGYVSIRGGDSGSGAGGFINLVAGNSDDSNGGNVEITAGDGYSNDGITGGNVVITSGDYGGNINLVAADGSDAVPAGVITITAGSSTDDSQTAGSISIASGSNVDTGDGANASITAGASSGTGSGGIVSMNAGASTSGTGGNAIMRGGAGDTGGDAIMKLGTGSTTHGVIRFWNENEDTIMFINSGRIVSTVSGNELTIRPEGDLYLQNTTGSSGNVYVQSQNTLYLQAANGGDTYVYAGDNSAGDGGDAYLYAGDGYTGGTTRIRGGDASTGNNPGGNVIIASGNGFGIGDYGSVRIEIGSGDSLAIGFDEESANSLDIAGDGYIASITGGYVRYIDPATISGSGTDSNAIHDNVAGEINAISEKVSPVGADVILIEDSADSYSKKKVQITNLPGGGGLTAPTTAEDGYVAIASGQDLVYIPGIADGYVLTWNAGLSTWESKSPKTIIPILHGTVTNDGYAWIEAGITEIDSSEYNYTTSTFEALLGSTDGYDDGYFIAEARLYNITTQTVVSSILSSESQSAELVSETITLSPGSNLYSVQLRMSEDGGGSEFVSCYMARIKLE